MLPPANRESKSKQVQRQAALNFYLNGCFRLGIDLKACRNKGAR